MEFINLSEFILQGLDRLGKVEKGWSRMAIKLDKLALLFVISISFGLRFEQKVKTAGIDFVILCFGNAIRTGRE